MAEIISISNQKGGVGKSSTTSALGAGLYLRGYKVLYIDMDAQANLSYSMGVTEPALTSLEVLTKTATVKEAIIKTAQGDLIPASPNLSGADIYLTQVGKEYRLKEALESVKDIYDFILIDTPPALGIVTVNALTACNGVIVPTQADIFSLKGIGQLVKTIEPIKEYCNSGLKIKGLLVNLYKPRSILTRELTEQLEEASKQLKTKVYNAKIRECVAIREAQTMQQHIFSYAKKDSNAYIDYSAFVDEFLSDAKKE